MGETDDKESVPVSNDQKSTKEDDPPQPVVLNQNEAEEAKETDKMLKKEDILANENNGEEKKDEEKKSTNGEEITKAPAEAASKLDAKEREVKPRKIPIGGIKMPGFFTKSKPAKSENDGAEGELLENAGNEAKAAEEAKPASGGSGDGSGRLDQILSSIKIRNPFKRQPKETTDEEKGLTKDDEQPQSLETTKPKDAEKPVEATKKPILGSIRAPLSNIIPKRFRARNADIEMGNGPNNRAGLASVETLDDSQKDIDKAGTGVVAGDVVDKAAVKSDDGMENIKLDNSDEKEKDIEKDDPLKEKPPAIMDRIRNYRCTSTSDLAIIGGVILFFITVAIILIFTLTGPPAIRDAPLRYGKYVDAVTSCGLVEGILDDGAYAFRGVPYAIPPTAENRWRSAELITNINNCWNGTFKAHNSTVCTQQLPNGTIVGTENCLTLDVITPYIRYYNPLPVVVLIGADTMVGPSPNKLRPSTRFARSHDVLFVRPNFRLGPFGFLSLEQLSTEAHPPTSGNYGLSDILAVLRWIELNIVHFGGNKNSVTLFGHRAGATLVTELVTSPLAKGLFTRAWVTSGAARFPGRPLEESERANTEYIQNAQCTNAECLRKLEANAILDAVPDTWPHIWNDLPSVDENTTASHNWLVVDGEIIQQHPADVWNREVDTAGPIKMVIGTTAHESHSEKLYLKHKEWTPELVREHIENSVIGQKNLTDDVLKLYPQTYQGLVQIISDIRTVCPLLTIARLQPNAPFYVVTQTSDELNLAKVDDDITAIMGRYEPHTPEQRRYVSQMQQLFYHYVCHGEMKQYEPRRRVLDIGQDALPFENYEHCDFWIANDIVPRYAKLD